MFPNKLVRCHDDFCNHLKHNLSSHNLQVNMKHSLETIISFEISGLLIFIIILISSIHLITNVCKTNENCDRSSSKIAPNSYFLMYTPSITFSP